MILTTPLLGVFYDFLGSTCDDHELPFDKKGHKTVRGHGRSLEIVTMSRVYANNC